MGQTLDWKSCVVRIDIDGKPNGTGFFVGEGLVLTCNHVVKNKAIASLSVSWQGKSISVSEVKAPNENIDLALLSVELAGHDWVVLDEAIAEREKLKTFGYPNGYEQGDPATFEYEGMTGDRQLIKFKRGQVEKGFSGSPLVNERTNQVCGVIAKTRDKFTDLGGRAVPVSVVWDIFPELKPKVTEIPANPFVPRSGRIDLPEQFFGREKELRSVFEILNSGSSVAIIGERQVGKSSFLKAISHHAEAQLTRYRRPVYLNFQDIYDDADFYEALCFEIGLEETLKGFRLKRAISKLDPPILLLLDEVEKMAWGGFTLQIRSQLRGLAEGRSAPLRLVVAASMDLDLLFPDSQGNVSPFKNICLNESLGFWNEKTVTEFVNARLSLTPINFPEKSINQIFMETEGHPQKVIEACYSLYEKYRKSK